MINQKTLRNIAVYGVSLPTFAVSPAVAKATVYMPSQVAARVFGGRPSMEPAATYDANQHPQQAIDTPHAA